MNPTREALLRNVANKRQNDALVILEDITDSHNVGAVLRTCDSVGVGEVHIYFSEKYRGKYKLGKRTTAGARKWVDVYLYDSREECFEAVRKKVDKIYCTHLGSDSVSVYDLPLTDRVALLFGNEHKGVQESTIKMCDGNFIIPQMGMVQSLNISVACAISLYELYRQRSNAGRYELGETEASNELFTDFVRRHEDRYQGRFPVNKIKDYV